MFFTFFGQYFFSENYTVYEIILKIMVQPDKLHMTI
jgi:hypothetical protein